MKLHLRATECRLHEMTQCYLPPGGTWHKWTHPALIPARGQYSIYLPENDGRLSWPRGVVNKSRSTGVCVAILHCWMVVVIVGAGGGKSGAVGRRHVQQAQDAGTRSKLAAQVNQHPGQSGTMYFSLPFSFYLKFYRVTFLCNWSCQDFFGFDFFYFCVMLSCCIVL